MTPFLSYSREIGRISRSANVCAVFCIRSCSSVSSNSTMGNPCERSSDFLMIAVVFNHMTDCGFPGATMRVFVAGATGVIGRRIVRQLVARGHEVVGLARGGEKEGIVRRLGGRPARGDLFDAATLAPVMKGGEVAIRAATAIPTNPRPRLAGLAVDDRVRTEGTRAMIEAASGAGVHPYIHESVVWGART